MRRSGVLACLVLLFFGAIWFASWAVLEVGRGPSDATESPAAAPPDDASHAGAAPRQRARATNAPVDGDEPADAAVAFTVSGTVVRREAKTPVADAEVRVARRAAVRPAASGLDLSPVGEPFATQRTDATGAYSFELPDAGPWTVEARAPGWAGPVRIVAAPAVVDLALSQVAGVAAITVRALPRGEPVAGADVHVVGDGDDVAPRLRGRTDEHGVVRLAVARDEMVVVLAAGFAFERVGTGGGDTTVWLQAGYSIAGVVRDASGAPVAGATLRRMGDAIAFTGGQALRFADAALRRWVTDADGRFVIDGLEPVVGDGVTFEVGATGYPDTDVTLLPGDADAVVVLGAVEPSPVPAPPGPPSGGPSHLSVRLSDAQGAIVSGVTVGVAGSKGAETPDGVTRFRVARPPGSRVRVVFVSTAEDGGSRTLLEAEAVTSAEPDAAPTEFRLPPRRELTIEARTPDGGEFRGSAGISVGERWWFQRVAPLRTTASSATFSVDPARRLFVSVAAEGYATVRRDVTSEEVAAGRAVVTMSPGATVRGRVVGVPVAAERQIQLSLLSTRSESSGFALGATTAPDDGRFAIDRVAPGPWRLDVRWPENAIALSMDLRVADDATVLDLGDLAVPALVRVHGVVTSADGRPVGGASATFQAEPDAAWDATAPVRGDGSFDLDLPATARGAVLVRKRGFGAAVARLDASSKSPVAVRLPPEGRLDVRVHLPVVVGSAWSWSVRTPDGLASWQPEQEVADDVPDVDDRFVWRGLAPGKIVVHVSGADWTLEREVVVVAGETTVVTLGEPR